MDDPDLKQHQATPSVSVSPGPVAPGSSGQHARSKAIIEVVGTVIKQPQQIGGLGLYQGRKTWFRFLRHFVEKALANEVLGIKIQWLANPLKDGVTRSDEDEDVLWWQLPWESKVRNGSLHGQDELQGGQMDS